MGIELVPAMDAFPVPGPLWLFHALLLLTFFLHLLFMNLTLGGTLLAAVAQIQSGGRPGDYRLVLAGRLMRVNTFAVSLTITTGIAPLLFVQVLYQQYFYVATILIAWVWLFMLVLLMVGYYAAYFHKFRGTPSQGSGGTGWLLVAALFFLLIAMVHVAVNLIHSQPDRWVELLTNPWAILGDAAYWPRLLHFVLASLALSGLIMAWWALRQAGRGIDPELNGEIATFAWKWALWTTLIQVVDGFVLLAVLPRRVLSGLMRGGMETLVPLTLAIVFALGLLIMLARSARVVEKPRLVSASLVGMIVAIAIMAITRHQVRALYLEPATSRFELVTAPQWGNFTLFALLFIVGLLVLFYMVREVLEHRSTGSEAA